MDLSESLAKSSFYFQAPTRNRATSCPQFPGQNQSCPIIRRGQKAVARGEIARLHSAPGTDRPDRCLGHCALGHPARPQFQKPRVVPGRASSVQVCRGAGGDEVGARFSGTTWSLWSQFYLLVLRDMKDVEPTRPNEGHVLCTFLPYVKPCDFYQPKKKSIYSIHSFLVFLFVAVSVKQRLNFQKDTSG